jgi:hypothetical protein
MRDEATIDAILGVLRDLWARNESMSVCGLIHAAVEPAVPNEEIRGLSDVALLRALRAMDFHGSDRPAAPGVVTAQHLAALDEARDYNAASSYNWLNAELAKLRSVVRSGGVIHILETSGVVVLASEAEFLAWSRGRYPHSDAAR